MAAVKRLPVHNHSADHIVWSFGIIEFIQSHFENRVIPKLVLVGGMVAFTHFITGHEQAQLNQFCCFHF